VLCHGSMGHVLSQVLQLTACSASPLQLQKAREAAQAAVDAESESPSQLAAGCVVAAACRHLDRSPRDLAHVTETWPEACLDNQKLPGSPHGAVACGNHASARQPTYSKQQRVSSYSFTTSPATSSTCMSRR
jgi:hypothetical protein